MFALRRYAKQRQGRDATVIAPSSLRRTFFSTVVTKAAQAAYADPTVGIPSMLRSRIHSSSELRHNGESNGNGNGAEYDASVRRLRDGHGNGNANTCNGTQHSAGLHHTVDTVGLLQGEIASLQSEVAQRDAVIAELRLRMADIEQQLKKVVAAAPSSAASSASEAAAPKFPLGAVVVQTSTDFTAALESRAAAIALPAKTVIRMPYGVGVTGYSLSIYGPEGCPEADRPVIETHVSLKGAKSAFTVHDATIRASSAAEPCIALGNGGRVDLHRATLHGGRDGLYASGKASAELRSCTVSGNVRGVFESQRCSVDLRGCRFVDNLFHCVLLAPATPAGIHKADRVGKDVTAKGNCFTGGRCDVALAHNPMEDSYSDTWRNGQPCVLEGLDNTAGLVEQSW